MQRSLRRVALALALMLALAGCSVTTPRDGHVASGDKVITGPATTTAEDAATDGASPSGATALQGGDTSGTSVRSATRAPAAGGQGSGGGSARAVAATDRSTASEGIGSTVGVTGDSIVISLIGGFSGPYGSLAKAWGDNAFGLWAAEINDRGGIHGRKLVIKQVDNRDTAEGGVAACKDVRGNGSFMAIIMWGLNGADMSSSDCLDKAGIPVIASNLANWRDTWRYVISSNDSAKQAVPIPSLIKNVIGDSAGKTGMIVNNDPVHLAARDAINRELKRLGMTHVRDEIVAVNQGSFVAELSRLREAGATTIVMVTGGEAIGIVRDAKAMGYNPNFTGLYWTADEFSEAAGVLWSGIKAVRVFPTSESTIYAEFRQKARKYGYDTASSTTVMAYYGLGLLVSDIVTKVGPALGRDVFLRTAGQMGDYNNRILALSFPPGVLIADVADFPVECCNPDSTWKGIGEPRREF